MTVDRRDAPRRDHRSKISHRIFLTRLAIKFNAVPVASDKFGFSGDMMGIKQFELGRLTKKLPKLRSE